MKYKNYGKTGQDWLKTSYNWVQLQTGLNLLKDHG